MTNQQLQNLTNFTGYPIEDLKTVHNSPPPKKQNEDDIVKEYKLSFHETLSVIQGQVNDINKL